MKKIIILILLCYSMAFAQVDTANYNFNVDLLTGKYTSLISKSTIFGAQGFKYVVQELQATSIDTTQFQYIGNIDGKYTTIQNISTYYGKDSGTVQMQLVNAPTSSSIDTSLIPFLNQNNTFTGNINTFTGKMVVGTGTSNGTADLLVMGDTTTIRGTLYRDSSYLRVLVNPFSQRLKVSVIGKTGNNMFTIDSTAITTTLSITTGANADITSGNDFILKNARYLVLGSNSGGTLGGLLRSTADGVISLTNAGGTAFSTFTVGAGNFTAGFIRGTVDTDITSVFCRTPNGTLRYILVADDGTISTSTTAP